MQCVAACCSVLQCVVGGARVKETHHNLLVISRHICTKGCSVLLRAVVYYRERKRERIASQSPRHTPANRARIQCVAVCCSALHCVAESAREKAKHLSLLATPQHICARSQCVAVYCSVLQCVAESAREIQKSISTSSPSLGTSAQEFSVLQCVAARCTVLQRARANLKKASQPPRHPSAHLHENSVCCSVLQYVAEGAREFSKSISTSSPSLGTSRRGVTISNSTFASSDSSISAPSTQLPPLLSWVCSVGNGGGGGCPRPPTPEPPPPPPPPHTPLRGSMRRLHVTTVSMTPFIESMRESVFMTVTTVVAGGETKELRLLIKGVAVCSSVLQCVAVCCSVLQRVAMCCSVLQCVAVRCNIFLCGKDKVCQGLPMAFMGEK